MFRFFFALAIIGIGVIGSPRASATEYWGFCKAGKAYHDGGHKKRKPEADWVCQAPTASQTGDMREKNTQRCISGQRRDCQVGAGGEAGVPGAHNVPRGAWYWVPGISEQHPDVRCECGCFTSDVQILTAKGPRPIGEMARTASAIGGYSVGTFDAMTLDFKPSKLLTNKDFTVGPEDEEVYLVVTEHEPSLTMTSAHPVLVIDRGEKRMVQAKALRVGMTVLLDDGTASRVTEVLPRYLEAGANLVYNLNTGGANDHEHVIVANNVRVGDAYWQEKLSERASRAANLLDAAQ